MSNDCESALALDPPTGATDEDPGTNCPGGLAEPISSSEATLGETDVTRPDEDVLTAIDLVKSYSGRAVVDHISLRVAKAEIVGFLGPNGAGKSTTIAMLTGSLKPDAGRVTVCGVDLAKRPRAAKAVIGVVPQEIALYPSLSAKENLRFFAGVYHIPRSARAERINWALDVVGLSGRASDRVASYSGGMQRRLNIAAGLLHRPRILFLDEPTVGVDPQSRSQIFDTLLSLRRDLGMAIVYTTHYMAEAERLCDRIVIIDHGHQLAEGSAEQLLESVGAGVLEWDLTAEEATRVIDDVRQIARRVTAAGECSAVDTHQGSLLRLKVIDMNLALREAMRVAEEKDIGLGGLRMSRPDLETLFLDLTGRRLRDGE